MILPDSVWNSSSARHEVQSVPPGRSLPTGPAVDSLIAAAIAGTGSNTNAVDTPGQTASGSCDPAQIQLLLDTLDELITAWRR